MITVYRKGLLNACASIDNLKKKYEVLSAKLNPDTGIWVIKIERRP